MLGMDCSYGDLSNSKLPAENLYFGGVIDALCVKRTRRQLFIESFRVESEDNFGNYSLISVEFHG